MGKPTATTVALPNANETVRVLLIVAIIILGLIIALPGLVRA